MYYVVNQFGWLPAWVLSAVFVFGRYLLMAGSVYLIFYVWLKARFRRYKIQLKDPRRSVVLSEVRHSFYTALIFATMGTGISVARSFGYTRQYTHIADYGIAYLAFSMVLLVFLHDTYFYWMHRLMHRPHWFRLIHRVHHESFNPTPMAALSFHPLEALLEFGIVPLVVLVIPLHPLALLWLSFWSMVWNIIGHLGFELFPKGFATHWFWGWVNTSTHHNMHHHKGMGNYGLYFNIWDRWMGTNYPAYTDTFSQIKARQ